MTCEEAIKELEELKAAYDIPAKSAKNETFRIEFENAAQAVSFALAALRGPTRERVEKAFRAHWEDVDSGSGMLSKCSNCGFKALYSNIYVFCPDCGSPFTDAAVDIVMERLEALYEIPTAT